MDFELNELQGTVPVEGWAQVISQHLMRHGTFHLLKVGSWVGSHVPTGHFLMDAMGEFSGYESYIYIYTVCIYVYICSEKPPGWIFDFEMFLVYP